MGSKGLMAVHRLELGMTEAKVKLEAHPRLASSLWLR